jgi:hypothetical protein
MIASKLEISQSIPEDEKNFQVYIRVRPLNIKERGGDDVHRYDSNELNLRRYEESNNNENGAKSVVKIENNIIYLIDLDYKNIDRKEKPFVFNGVFGEHFDNKSVFSESVQPNLDYLINGYNATFFAYGMTGSGKTHTIFGNNNNERGICFLALEYVLRKTKELYNKTCNMRLSYLEIYNENVRDLLSDSSKSLMITEDPVKG